VESRLDLREGRAKSGEFDVVRCTGQVDVEFVAPPFQSNDLLFGLLDATVERARRRSGTLRGTRLRAVAVDPGHRRTLCCGELIDGVHPCLETTGHRRY